MPGPITTKHTRPLPRRTRHDPFDVAAWLLLAALLAASLLTFRDYAISNDEEVQHRYGELILSYYASGFADRGVFAYKNLYLYGGLFDVVAILFGRILPLDIFVIRHLLCALIGIGGIAAVWATARLIAGPRAGLIATVALTVCGPWFGSMFNHTKDIPFAAAMMGALYFLLRAARNLPRPRLLHLVLFGLLLGAALGQRALALLVLIYVPIMIALRLPSPVTAANAGRFLVGSLLLFLPAFALGYLIMIAAWPWAALSLFNPVRALFAFAHFHYPIKTLLFGKTYLMADVPRWYVPVYLAIKLPLAVWFGAALALLMAFVRGWTRLARTRDRLHRFHRGVPGGVSGHLAWPLVQRPSAFPFCAAANRGACGDRLRRDADVVRSAAACARGRRLCRAGRRDGVAGQCHGPAASLRVVVLQSAGRWPIQHGATV